MTNLWFLGTVYFQREDRIFSARGLYIFNIWGPYIFADRIFSAKWPYIFSDRTVYFQRLGTVYFRRPYILSRGPYIFSSRTVYFQPSGPYIFSLDRIFYVWPPIPPVTRRPEVQIESQSLRQVTLRLSDPSYTGVTVSIILNSSFLKHMSHMIWQIFFRLPI